MISILKLELVKILLQNKINRINETITQLEKIINFFEESENEDILLRSFLNKQELEAVTTIFWLSFVPVQDGVCSELRRKFHQLSDEYIEQTIEVFTSNINDLISDLMFDEIDRVKQALNKVQHNIDQLKNK